MKRECLFVDLAERSALLRGTDVSQPSVGSAKEGGQETRGQRSEVRDQAERIEDLMPEALDGELLTLVRFVTFTSLGLGLFTLGLALGRLAFAR
jgi:hypothetical protein